MLTKFCANEKYQELDILALTIAGRTIVVAIKLSVSETAFCRLGVFLTAEVLNLCM